MKTELLAPAGSFETIKAAFSAGADAVYTGGTKFGARAYANNLEQEEMLQAIDYTHMRNKKLYLTVNTMLTQDEIVNEVYEYLLPFYEAGLDAVIVQDYGILRMVSQCFPDLAIHCSTQMTITGPESAAMMEELGATRVVTAREISLKEIAAIRETTSLEIESFVHGALCYCYSGQCLMSSMIGGRSGNRGKCAQPCRLPYDVFEKKRKLTDRNSRYPLSPKDMCTIDLLPEILQAGVSSLKIEGRMKKPEYTAGVVSIYRKYLDRVLEGNFHGVSEKDHQKLFDIFNRDGFNKGYYQVRNGKSMMALQNQKENSKNKNGSSRNEKLFADIKANYIEKKDPIFLSFHGIFHKDQPSILTLESCGHKVVVEGETPQMALKQAMTEERIEKQLSKTGNTQFAVKNALVEADPDIFISITALNDLRRKGIAALMDALTQLEDREDARLYPFAKEFSEEKEVPKKKNSLFSASVERKEQAEAALATGILSRIYADTDVIDDKFIALCKSKGVEPYLMLPRILRERELPYVKKIIENAITLGVKGFLVFSPEMYAYLRKAGFVDRTVIGASMSGWNNLAEKQLQKLGMEGDILSAELNFHHLMGRDNRRSFLTVYGYTPLMTSAQCVKKNMDACKHENSSLTLRDRKGISFSVRCDCRNCYNIIYNSLPTYLLSEITALDRIEAKGYHFDFTRESGRETGKILKEFITYYNKKENGKASFECTKGHFRRGV